MTEPLCADCGHEMGVHDPCSTCAGEGRGCRAFATVKTKRHRGTGKRKAASKRRKP